MRRGFLSRAGAAKLSPGGQEVIQAPRVDLEVEKPSDVKEDKTRAIAFTYNASIGWTLKYSVHTFIHVVVPTSNSPDGTTDCLIWGLEDKKLIPKYLSPMRKRKAYEIRNATAGKTGLSVFATHDLQLGDLIMCERPILLVPRLLDGVITGKPNFFPPSKNPANREAWESIFRPFFERISKEKQEEYLKLENGHPEDGIGPLLGIYRTNNYEHSLHEMGEKGNLYGAVYKDLSRINHSCASSNSQPRFDPRSFSIELRALRDIKAGDEIFTSYCSDKPGTTAERQKHLALYGFQCACASCTSPTSDHFYLKLLSTQDHLDESYESWLKDPTLPDDHIIKPSLVWVSLMEKHGLPVKMMYYRQLDIITKSFVALGDLENSVKHGVKLARYLIAMTGREQLLAERSDPNYYLCDRNFGVRRRVGSVGGKTKGKGKGKGKGGKGEDHATKA